MGEELFGYLGEAFPKPFLLPQYLPQTLITRRAFSRVHDYLGCGRVIVYLRDFLLDLVALHNSLRTAPLA